MDSLGRENGRDLLSILGAGGNENMRGWVVGNRWRGRVIKTMS